MATVAEFIRLDRRDRALVIAAARTLAVTWIELRATGFNAVRRRAARVAGRNSQAHSWCGPLSRWSVSPPTVERISWSVRAASRFIPGASNCLVHALATRSLLDRFGYRSELRIGVRKVFDGGLAAHAWLESAGAVVIGEFGLDHYVPLAPPESSRPGLIA
jgi:hypothetical protein